MALKMLHTMKVGSISYFVCPLCTPCHSCLHPLIYSLPPFSLSFIFIYLFVSSFSLIHPFSFHPSAHLFSLLYVHLLPHALTSSSPIHSPMHSTAHSLTLSHSLTSHSLTHLLIYSLTLLLVHSFGYFNYIVISLLNDLLT